MASFLYTRAAAIASSSAAVTTVSSATTCSLATGWLSRTIRYAGHSVRGAASAPEPWPAKRSTAAAPTAQHSRQLSGEVAFDVKENEEDEAVVEMEATNHHHHHHNQQLSAPLSKNPPPPTPLQLQPLRPLSSLIDSAPRSGIREVMAAAALLERTSGDRVLHLEVGLPNFGAPQAAVEAAKADVQKLSHQGYIANEGLGSARDAVARYYSQRRGLPTDPANIVMTQGSLFAIATAFGIVLDADDEVLVPDPGFPNYEMGIHMLKGVPVPYALEPHRDWQPCLESLEAAITPRTKLLVICSPSNPTGAVLSHENMQEMINFARARGLYVLSDEIYAEICFDLSGDARAPSALECDHDPRSLMVASGVSKSHALTGFRVGWLRCHEELVSSATLVTESFYSCGVPFCQSAAAAALDHSWDEVAEMRQAYTERRDLVCAILKAHGRLTTVPRGAFYVMVNVKSALRNGETTTQFAARFLQDERVAVAPGDTFGNRSKDFVRISLASDKEVLVEGVTRLCEYMAAHSWTERRGGDK